MRQWDHQLAQFLTRLIAQFLTRLTVLVDRLIVLVEQKLPPR
jgi:nitrogen-specific signal transduction histidine kinase